MQESQTERIAALERGQRLNLVANLITLVVLAVVVLESGHYVNAQPQQAAKVFTASEFSVIDDRGVVRARLGVNLPDAVINGKVTSRGQRAAGLLLYDETGQERGGYVTFSPSGNVGLTLDNRTGQAAEFVADPQAGAAIRVHWQNDAVELRADEDGPSIHAVRGNGVAFHEPAVKNPEATEMCKFLRQAKARVSATELLNACRARTSEAACQACLTDARHKTP